MDVEFGSLSRVAAESLAGASDSPTARAGTAPGRDGQPFLIELPDPVSLTFGSPSL